MHWRHSWHALLVIAAILASAAPIRAAPQRVVSVFLCTDEYVFRLVPKARIAALSVLAADTHPTVSTIAGKVKGIPLVRPSAEAVLARHPDLVVLYKGANPRMRAHLIAAGVAILEVPPANALADIRATTLMLGRRLGTPDRAKALLAEMDDKLAAARAKAPRPPVTALIYEPNGYATSDRIGDAIMKAAGLKDVAGSFAMTRMGRIPVEAVLAAAPRLLILNAQREGGPALADAAIENPALASLKARSLVVKASLTPLLCPGPWSADVAPELARLGRKAARLARGPGPH